MSNDNAPQLVDLLNSYDRRRIGGLKDDELRGLMSQLIEAQQQDRRENQLLYYKPVSSVAEAIHKSTSRYLGIGGGNGASKTETALVELVMHATGIYPPSLKPDVLEALQSKFRGPVACRVVVASLTTTLTPIILPKLQWWQWSGVDQPGGDRGHWGWLPKHVLKGGTWSSAWSEKLRMLRVLCRDPEDPERILGESTFQFMAHTQEPADFASGDFHHILHDEMTSWAIWRENEARTMRVGGRMLLAMTWPDDPAIPVDWAYDLLYEKGRAGPQKVKNVDWFEMWSSDNPNLDQDAVAEQAEHWSESVRAVRLQGQPIRFSNRVHPLFTDTTRTWCITCKEPRTVQDHCEVCGAKDDKLVEYNHVRDFDVEPSLPTIFLLDPHPRKPHMALWVQVDTWNDLWVVAECSVEGGPDEVRAVADEIEQEYSLRVEIRLGDPNMLKSPSSARRGVTWRDEFDAVGLGIDYGDTSDVGRSRLNDYLKVDPDTRRPRIHIHSRCATTIMQLSRYVWSDFKQHLDRDQKQVPKDKNDDFPTLLKYLMNYEPSHRDLVGGHQVLRTR